MSNEFKDWVEEQSPIEKEIVAKYPFLVSPYARDAEGNIKDNVKLPLIPLEIPEGWLKLLYQMCDDIKEYAVKNNCLDNIYFLQVKEKYGQLVCYVGYKNLICDDNVEKIINTYSELSKYVCIECGKFATGWFNDMIPFCAACLVKTLSDKKFTQIPLPAFGKAISEHIDMWRKYLDRVKENKDAEM